MRYAPVKRLLDIVGAVCGLVALAAPIAIVALLIRVRLGAPVLYRARRPGLRGEPFTMYKFRTMRDLFDADGRALPDSVRITPLGRALRRTSVDELPELYNVLRGDMSLVGPRPLCMHYLDLYTPEQARRHDIRPGITGLAQVQGRNAVAYETRFAYDVWYVDHVCLWLDVRILARTIVQVLRRQDVGRDGDLDTTFFQGSRPA